MYNSGYLSFKCLYYVDDLVAASDRGLSNSMNHPGYIKIKLAYSHLPEHTEENHERPQSGQLTHLPGFEPGILYNYYYCHHHHHYFF